MKELNEIKLKDLQPSQFYISKEKLDTIEKWFNPKDLSNFKSIPIKELDGKFVMTDGHTRVVLAIINGLDKLPLEWDNDDLDWDMYKECVRECERRNILSPYDLLNNIISKDEYDVKWNKWCDKMQEEVISKRNK